MWRHFKYFIEWSRHTVKPVMGGPRQERTPASSRQIPWAQTALTLKCPSHEGTPAGRGHGQPIRLQNYSMCGHLRAFFLVLSLLIINKWGFLYVWGHYFIILQLHLSWLSGVHTRSPCFFESIAFGCFRRHSGISVNPQPADSLMLCFLSFSL